MYLGTCRKVIWGLLLKKKKTKKKKNKGKVGVRGTCMITQH